MQDIDVLTKRANQDIFRQFAKEALYNNIVLENGAVLDESIDLVDHDWGQVVARTTGIMLMREDVDKPERGDLIDIGNRTFSVEGELERDETTVLVEVRHG